ncbi:hypothetical protein DC347_19760 [Pseudarthrobacter sp. AG30]|uniref:hypothetical protein n=1 Tax=Micrococcaceae TaxID=1268 RepID=UPI000D6EA65D|nr:hypothetical protein [Micrococcaceae]RAX14946.1 hypothetical protein DC347_19760 [Pseudarthrobacter sp. AG30]
MLTSPRLVRPSLDGNSAPQGKSAIHCGTAMQLVTPAVGSEGASYTFAPADSNSIELPPVWRCGCGFQLDAWPAGGDRKRSAGASRQGSSSAVLPA